jgi:predicted RND superfamily exporter protein
MTELHALLIRFFDRFVLKHPKKVILCLLVVVSFLGYQAKDFKLDASAETLVLENDEDLRYARLINSRYGQNEYLFLAYTPKGDLFSEKTLKTLARLRDELKQLKGVTSVVSILDVPLLESPPVPIKQLAGNMQTLESETVNRNLARVEFKISPLYQNLLISANLKTTALQINLPIDHVYRDLLSRRNHLRAKHAQGALTADQAVEYQKVSRQFQQHRDTMRRDRHRLITAIRAIMDKYRQEADLFLGGVSMIADDLISFIKSDLKIFGLGVLFFLIVTLAIIFKRSRWILLPILCCALSALSMIGLLGLFGWEVTVISSNFISLQLIITMAIAIHLVVRYRELHSNHPQTDQRKLILDTVRLKFKPCLYAALTTIAGFGSLVLCDILPVINFGWMMIGGIAVSLIITFLIFPTGLLLLKKDAPPTGRHGSPTLTALLARLTEAHGSTILVIGCLAFMTSIVGISKLEVENSFIDYFKESTEIYQGMKVIDQHLGGTTPLDVVIDLGEPSKSAATSSPGAGKAGDDEFAEFDEFDQVKDDAKYWFTTDKMAQVVKIHEYLDNLKETGKVLSLATLLKIGERLNNGSPLDNFMLALLYSKLPAKFKGMLLKPYVSVENNQIRFSVRVRDSEKTLKRNLLLKRIHRDLTGQLGIKKDNIHLTGLLVLYNNMLQSLFDSQILTLGITSLALMGMFLILFRSIKIALIALFPNLLSVAVVLGVMGWLGVPLDMMTITIAAISIGIAVDNSIHYIHRYKQEFEVDRNYLQTMHRCHGSIGNALYFTSLTIIIGFSILSLSNFIPSIYFGLLTGLAMLIALFGALTLLPELLIFIKPLGPEMKNNYDRSSQKE